MAQANRDFIYYDKASYEYYNQKEWDELIKVGNEALKSNFDFYYLRARLGIAYYEKGNYAKAIHHIKKALEFNTSNPVMIEYLYYSFQFSNRYLEASRLYFKNINILKDVDLFIKPKAFDYLTIQGGYKLSDQYIDLGTEAGNIYYGSLGATINIKGRFLLYQYLSLLGHTFIDKFIDQNYLYYYQYNINQFEYYVNGDLLLGKGWTISPAYHFIRVNAISEKYNDYYFGVSVRKNFNRVRIGLNGSKAYVYDTNIKQLVPEISYYPLGNSKIYFVCKDLYHQVENEDPVHHIYGLMGIKIFHKTWLEGYYSYGKARFLSYDNGYTLYNNPDYLVSRGGIHFYQYFNNNTRLVLTYQVENKEQFNTGSLYSHNCIMAGLDFKF